MKGRWMLSVSCEQRFFAFSVFIPHWKFCSVTLYVELQILLYNIKLIFYIADGNILFM